MCNIFVNKIVNLPPCRGRSSLPGQRPRKFCDLLP